MIDSTIILPSKPRVISEDQVRGVYETEGLYPGYGHTLGNSLRRIILSSLQGAAITSLKIDGATHEFATLPGLKEDVIMVILNLKKIRFRLSTDEPQKMTIEVKGAKTVTAADIKGGSQVEIINPEQVVANVTDKKAGLHIELTVEKGLGYLPKEAIRQAHSDIGLIYLDAVFTPIRRVSYEVENMRVGDRTDYNRLRLIIETDGTISPREALDQAIGTMINQLKAMVGFRNEEEDGEAVPETGLEAPRKDLSDNLKTRIDDLELSARTIKALTGSGIRTVGGLVRKREADLLALEGFGDKGLEEIKAALTNLGLTLKD